VVERPIKKKGDYMERRYVKSLPEYDKVEFDYKKSKADQLKRKRMPTSINLSPITVKKLKAIAKKKDIPYQVLMRCLIIEGLYNLEKEKK
jgi:hypothetical protein